ncbi:hypothetical protein JOC49_001512 [Fusibacter tunisiensis]|uniref:Uncharacterized protein n=1 Tax=Fusibacter tunisiensis TaxID=1008308 RepID=A0ABS2MRD0_9FIRM|nr:hypothetical protein [Fusibacter tunisiensis]
MLNWNEKFAFLEKNKVSEIAFIGVLFFYLSDFQGAKLV